MNKVKKILKVGDVVYSANQCKEMKVLRMCADGFYTEEDFFCYDEIRETYFLTKAGYRHMKGGANDEFRKKAQTVKI